jgi:hypothetical protein
MLMYHYFAAGHFGRVELVVTIFPSERAHANHSRFGAGNKRFLTTKVFSVSRCFGIELKIKFYRSTQRAAVRIQRLLMREPPHRLRSSVRRLT